jgi:acyl-CoA reductase-like NAD-dependent aldehyde dehydrogenase
VTDVINPATGTVLTSVPSLGLAETDAAIERAPASFWIMAAGGARGPGAACCGASRGGRRHREELAGLEVRNAGHTIGNARWEAGNVRDVLDYYAGAPERLSGRQIPVAGGLDVTFHEPLGVVGIIVPWNFPMPIAGWGLRPGARGRQHR